PLNLSVTAAGTVPAGRVRYRSGASEDEAICVSGDLGGAIAGLRILMREKEIWQEQGEQQAFQPDLEEYEYVVGRQLVPAARRDVVEALGQAGLLPGALTDVSRGHSWPACARWPSPPGWAATSTRPPSP
ncbi:MAG: hypothetical protein U5K31_12475, partial [Balneolaceae bacterium]|nr:hypothetical protein [Balneolaceae bacterium]